MVPGTQGGFHFSVKQKRGFNLNTAPALAHLLLHLRPLNRALRQAVARQGQAAARLFHPDVTPLCVTEEQVQMLLDNADQLLQPSAAENQTSGLTSDELAAEEQLRNSPGLENKLPLDRLHEVLGLTAFEQEAILLCAAVELDRSYERIYAYILDDLNRRYPCVELLCSLTAETITERCERRNLLGPYGKLRRTELLRTYGESATGLRQELRLAPGLLDFLTGHAGDVTPLFSDVASIPLPSRLLDANLPADVDPAVISRVGSAMRDGRIAVLGIWGPRQAGQREVAIAVAIAASLPLRHSLFNPTSVQSAGYDQRIAESVQMAAALGAVLWVETDVLTGQGNENLSGVSNCLATYLAAARTPIILTGTRPWRPTELLKAQPYAQLEIEAPNYAARQTMWARAFPEVSKEQRDDLATRFRLSAEELNAVARMAGTQACVAENGHGTVAAQLEDACDAVTRKQTYHFATVIRPRRGPKDLVLPESLHKQVIEIAHFHRAWPRVADGWGFGRMITGEGGIKVLFTGPSGTGKTLAAEVIAYELGMALLKIDLSRVVSKWVGETERNLERAFSEAEDSNAVLFFDEADSLFGKRGEVRHGVDRYSNLEVSFLLQRLETHYGLVILASNLRENIDQAFTRRFQIVLSFPRPEPAERSRIWALAFPKAAPLQEDIDFEVLSRLDMTGASIVNAAQTAALLAVESARVNKSAGASQRACITRAHVVRAISRQYQREARLLTPSELGPYASLLEGAR
jgi:hypothetical protein